MEAVYIVLVIVTISLVVYFINRNGNTNNNAKENVKDFLDNIQPAFDKFKLMPIFTGDVPAILRGEEYPVLVLNCSLYEERNYRNYYGGSFRVTKGVSLFAGQSRSQTELQKLDNGSLIITDERLIFIGNKRNTNIEYTNLLSLECYDNCVTVHKIGKSRAEVFFTSSSEIIKYFVEIFLKYKFIIDDDKAMIIEVNQYEYGMKRLNELIELLKDKTSDKDVLFESIMKFIEDFKNGKISNYHSRNYIKRLDNTITSKNS